MNIENYYWYFQSAIPNRICDDIARYGKQLQDEMAVTGGLGAKKLKVSFMIGTVIVGTNLILIKINHKIHKMVKLENYLLQLLYPILKNIKVVN